MILTENSARLELDLETMVSKSFTPRKKVTEAPTHCAYNQTRECFLGLEIATGDLSAAALAETMKSLPLRSGQGFWIMPFRGQVIPELPVALDLIFLDNECRVMKTAESLPTFRSDFSKMQAASVLALPIHSIYSSQTQVGDQLIVACAEEMERHLEKLAAGDSQVSIQSAAILREQPMWSEGSGVLEFVTPTLESNERRHQMDLANLDAEEFRAPKNWLERWWSPDPRRAPRQPVHELAAYFWNGGTPQKHGIRDISNSGIYLVTEERWYPGTLVMMILQRTDSGAEVGERSITVQTRAVRWGQDGVGMQFVLPKTRQQDAPKDDQWQVATPKELERFLRKLKHGK
jgi:hypothetical protein